MTALMTWLGVHIISVYPFAADFAAISAPMLPPAPARLSTTICWPSSSDSGGASARETKSTPLPCEDGAINRMGLLGYGCAAATPATKNKSAHDAVPA